MAHPPRMRQGSVGFLHPQGPSHALAHPLKVFPAMVSASFEALTTLSNGISRPGDLGSRVCCVGIAILGQL